MTEMNQDRAATPPAPTDMDAQPDPVEDWRLVQPPTTPHSVLLHWAIFALVFGGVIGVLVLIY